MSRMLNKRRDSRDEEEENGANFVGPKQDARSKVATKIRVISGDSAINGGLYAGGVGVGRISSTARMINLDVKRGAGDCRDGNSADRDRALLGNYLRWLKDQGYRLPEDPKRRGKVFYRQLRVEAGIRGRAVTQTGGYTADLGSDLHGLVEEAATYLGVEVRVLPQSPGQRQEFITYRLLLEKGTEERSGELRGKSNAAQQCYNTRAALRLFCRALGLSESLPVGIEFAADFDGRAEDVASRIEKMSSRRKFRAEISWWQNFYLKLIKEQALPDDFHCALAHLASRSGLTASVLAALAGTSTYALSGWLGAKFTPSSRSHQAIIRMEALFKLPAGTLTSKLPSSSCRARVPVSQLPDFLREDKTRARRVAPHLPDDFCSLPGCRQEEIVASVESEILRSNDPYTEKLRSLFKLRYSLRAWPRCWKRSSKT